MILPPPLEGSAQVAARVLQARQRQEKRYAALGLDRIATNAACPPALLEEVAQPDPDGLSLIRDAANAMRLSARGFHRVLKVGRTLADLDGEERVRRIHVAEALSYRAHADRRSSAA
jgi:magnesium chelatase family protein